LCESIDELLLVLIDKLDELRVSGHGAYLVVEMLYRSRERWDKAVGML
jgi:hypothetical protein